MIKDVVISDLEMAKSGGLLSAAILRDILDLVQQKDADVVSSLKSKFLDCKTIQDQAERELAQALINLYLHMLGSPEKDLHDH